MNYKNAITMTILSVIAILTITSISVSANEVFAASVTNFKMVEDTYAKTTFTFRSGIEEIYFPVYKMTASYVGNNRAEFQLQGVVEDYPYLNEAMDQAYDFSNTPPSTQYEYKQFNVDVDLVKGGVTQKNIHYTDCRIVNSVVDTLLDNAEGYTTIKTGFALVNVIDFTCTSVMQSVPKELQDHTVYSLTQVHDYGKNSQKLAEDVHSYATFYFNQGTEKVDFPIFKLNTGFDETSKDRPSFTVEGIAKSYTLLDAAINTAQSVAGMPSSYHESFQVDVDFANDSKTFRTLKFTECRIEEYKIDTLFDKEEGYTGKSGFAIVQDITVTCAGITTKNYGDISETLQPNPYMMGGFTQAFVTIKADNGVQEKYSFPVFKQTSTVSYQNTEVTNKAKPAGTTPEASSVRDTRLNPQFELQGVVSETPLLYKLADQIRTRGYAGSDYQGLFDAAVDIVHNEKLVKTYQYEKCRVTTYDSDTSSNAEEGYVGSNGFALLNTYKISCTGYHPSNPSFEKMNTPEKADLVSSLDLRRTDSWGPNFTVQK